MNSVEIANELKELLKGGNINTQLSVPQLVEKAVTRGEAKLTIDGAIVAETGKYTGRSPKDKFIVEEESIKDKIDWGSVNQPISAEVFDNLYIKVLNYLKEKDELFVSQLFLHLVSKRIQLLTEQTLKHLLSYHSKRKLF